MKLLRVIKMSTEYSYLTKYERILSILDIELWVDFINLCRIVEENGDVMQLADMSVLETE